MYTVLMLAPLLLCLIVLVSTTTVIAARNTYSQEENVTISVKTVGEILDNVYEAKSSLQQNNTVGVNSSLNGIESLLLPYNETLRSFSLWELSLATAPPNMTALNMTLSPLQNITSSLQNMTAPNITTGK
jgi:hypothetical protein